jgi:hypothetical protein
MEGSVVIMEIPTNEGSVIEGLPEAEMDKLMSELLQGGSGNVAQNSGTGEQGWDKMALLTGGFVPVGSIFWARPPKLRSQQKILIALSEADKQEAVKQADILCTLAASLFYVREGSEFRKATEDEIGGDEAGLTAQEITTILLKLMDIDPEMSSGNA